MCCVCVHVCHVCVCMSDMCVVCVCAGFHFVRGEVQRYNVTISREIWGHTPLPCHEIFEFKTSWTSLIPRPIPRFSMLHAEKHAEKHATLKSWEWAWGRELHFDQHQHQ